MRLVWNSFLSPPSSDRVKEPFQPLFFCFNRRAYGTAVDLDGSTTAAPLAKITNKNAVTFIVFFLRFFALRYSFSIPVFAPRAHIPTSTVLLVAKPIDGE